MKKQELLFLGKNFGLQINIVEKILLKKTGLTKSQFFLSENIKISEKVLEELKDTFRKVVFGYPIEYVLEKAEFYGLDFYVDKRCLIPRNDTEVMVDKAIDVIIKNKESNILYIDVGTGSGAIPISVYINVGHIIDKSFALDISKDALGVAEKNIKTHNLLDKIKLLESDLLSKINFENDKQYIITANLPYIKNEDFGNMDKDVILHEPSVALYGGEGTGFELYEKLITQILVSKINATLFIEIGFDQKDYSIKYLESKNLIFEIFKDNGGIDRCLKIEF